MVQHKQGSALLLVLICMTALVSICLVMSRRAGRSAELMGLIKLRQEQYLLAEKLMDRTIELCKHDWDNACSYVATETTITARAIFPAPKRYEGKVSLTATNIPNELLLVSELLEQGHSIMQLSCVLQRKGEEQPYYCITHWREL